MRGAQYRRERGYVLAEALVGGAVMMLAVAGALGALSQANEQLGRALADQSASQLATEQLERLRAQPASSPAWAVGATPCPGTTLPPGWTCTLTVTQVDDTHVGGPVSGPLVYKRGVVQVDYRGTSLSLETLRW